MKLMLFVDPPGKPLQDLVGPALGKSVINLGGSCLLLLSPRLPRQFKTLCLCTSQSGFRSRVQRERISLRKEQ